MPSHIQAYKTNALTYTEVTGDNSGEYTYREITTVQQKVHFGVEMEVPTNT